MGSSTAEPARIYSSRKDKNLIHSFDLSSLYQLSIMCPFAWISDTPQTNSVQTAALKLFAQLGVVHAVVLPDAKC